MCVFRGLAYSGEDKSRWVVARNKEEAARLAREQFGTDENLVQDENVLDTWFRFV
jgi:valyl-tRNA synthetase